MKNIEYQAAEALRTVFSDVPPVAIESIEVGSGSFDREIDILAHVSAFGRAHILVCEVKSSGQPRHVHSGLLQVQRAIRHIGKGAIPVFIAPFLSPEAQALCQEENVGFLDFEGNCRLVFDGIFIERKVPTRPAIERRELKSIFKPKSAQVLRVMLRDPHHAWRVTELADAASVSLGHVSNVRTALVDREWAKIGDDGMSLIRPAAVLDAWRNSYEPPAGDRQTFYTTLHGKAFDQVVRDALGASNRTNRAILASFSAAQWIAPYARVGSQFFYADSGGLDCLRHALKLSSAVKGENVVVTILKDEGPLLDTIEPAPGVVCTSPVQTYLDLAISGERGQEAADYLRQEKLQWLQ
ncbi:type IV toxin-antitoxin system AbiEi family antitoxin [Mesorhizobium tianshanense]|uniref:type IV toxin-antitoxin system AbiEi family antitoxin n=1 Tax=Mesorhizobium tianshanense TaxID=39844 RepID=UPI001F0A4711|nr:type IV toxin-antitoxin system AbiEi family antitoxin [Mesorhizobium tianshanense]